MFTLYCAQEKQEKKAFAEALAQEDKRADAAQQNAANAICQDDPQWAAKFENEVHGVAKSYPSKCAYYKEVGSCKKWPHYQSRPGIRDVLCRLTCGSCVPSQLASVQLVTELFDSE